MGFIVATESALEPWDYFSPYGFIHSLQASHLTKGVVTACLYA